MAKQKSGPGELKMWHVRDLSLSSDHSNIKKKCYYKFEYEEDSFWRNWSDDPWEDVAVVGGDDIYLLPVEKRATRPEARPIETT